MGLFMRPITPQSPVANNCKIGAGGYRTFLDLRVIGAIIIGLSIIGLAGAMVIDHQNFTKFPITLDGTGTRPATCPGQDKEKNNKIIDHYYQRQGDGALESSEDGL